MGGYIDVNCAMGRERAGRWERLLMGRGPKLGKRVLDQQGKAKRALGVEEMICKEAREVESGVGSQEKSEAPLT